MIGGNAVDDANICMPPNSSMQHALMQVSSGAAPAEDRLILSPADHLFLPSPGAPQPSDSAGTNDPGPAPGIDSPARLVAPSASDPVFRVLENPTSVLVPFPPDVAGSGGAALSRTGSADLPHGFSTPTSPTAVTSSSAPPSVVAADPVAASPVPGSASEVDSQAPSLNNVSDAPTAFPT
jgi:hypothetical protein